MIEKRTKEIEDVKMMEWIKTESDYLPSDEDIRQLEEKLGFSFPEDYIKIMKQYDGAYPSIRTFDLPDDEDCMNNLLSFDETNSQSIMFAYKIIVERGVNNLIPIARDPFGNYICYKKDTDTKLKIVFWDHENPENTIELCDNFSEFLGMLYE